jgi:hypothetical protein
MRASAALPLVIAVVASCAVERNLHDPNSPFSCSADAQCLPGYRCLDGLCQPVGTNTASDAGADVASDGKTTDGAATTGDGETAGDAPSYTGLCNLLTWEGCTTGKGCYLNTATGQKICSLHGNVAPGEICAYLQDCVPGYVCYAVGAEQRCVRLCDTSTGAGCTGALTCKPLADAQAMPWPDKAGVCE